MKPAPWLDIAMREAGVKTFAEGVSNPRIEEYHRTVSTAAWSDKIPWCSTYLYWCMQQAGIQGSRSALARSWLAWGESLSEPRHGCIAVLWRKKPDSAKGHVGIFLREDSTHVHLWGGNQLDEVREHFYPKNMVLGFRWPVEPRDINSAPGVRGG